MRHGAPVPEPRPGFLGWYKKRNPEIDRVWLSRRCYGTTFSMIRTPASYDAWAPLLAVALVRDTGITFDRSLPPTARAPVAPPWSELEYWSSIPRQCILPSMIGSEPSVHFEIVSASAGYRVRMTRPNGYIQYIGGFETKSEASSWIATKGAGWFRSTEEALDRI